MDMRLRDVLIRKRAGASAISAVKDRATGPFNLLKWSGALSKDVVGTIMLYLLGTTTAAGAGVGWLASKVTSPSSAKRELLQKDVLDANIREALGRRQREVLTVKERNKREAEKPSVSKKRDMFV